MASLGDNNNSNSSVEEKETAFVMGDALADPSSCLGRARNACGGWMNHKVVQLLHAGLMLINLIVFGMMAGCDGCGFRRSEPLMRVLDLVEIVLLFVFTIETGLQIFYLGCIGMVTKNPWTILDTCTVVLSWLFVDIQAFRSMSLAHVVLSNMPWPAAGRNKRAASLVASWGLWMYSTAAVASVLFGGLYENGLTSEPWFDTLGRSLVSLLRVMVFVGWSDTVSEVGDVYRWAPIFFGLFLAVAWPLVIWTIVVLSGACTINLRSRSGPGTYEQSITGLERRPGASPPTSVLGLDT